MAVLNRVRSRDSRALDRLLRPYERAARHVSDNFDSLVERYTDEWVAVSGETVLAHSKSRAGLKRDLADRLITTSAFITFLTRKERVLIL